MPFGWALMGANAALLGQRLLAWAVLARAGPVFSAGISCRVSGMAAPKASRTNRIAAACFQSLGDCSQGAAMITIRAVAAGNAIIWAAGAARICQNKSARAVTDGRATAIVR